MKLGVSKKILIPGLIIFLSVVSILAIGLTQVEVIKKLGTSVEKLEKDNEDLRSKYLMLSSLDKKNIERQAALAELAVPSEKNIPFILQSFRDAVDESDFVIKEFKFTPGEISKEKASSEEVEKRIDELPLTASLVGSSDNFKLLLNNLETTFPIFEVEEAKFSRDKESRDKAKLDLSLITFYSPPLVKLEYEDLKLDQLVLNEEEEKLLEELNSYSRPELKRGESGGLKRKSDNPFVF